MGTIDFFGIDIGDDLIHMAQIRKDGKSFELVHIFQAVSPSSLLNSDQTYKALSENIRKAFSASHISTKNCVFAIAEKNVFSRLLEIPEVEETKIDEAISWALKPLLPTDISNVNISYIDINQTTVNGKKMRNWYAVAAPKLMVNKLRGLFRMADLNLLAIETETLAISRAAAVNHGMANEDMLLVDIGAEDSNIILCRNGVTLFSQSVGAGTHSLDKVLMADLQTSIDEVQKLKFNFNTSDEATRAQILKSAEPVLEVMFREISRTLIYYKEKVGVKEINKLFVSAIDSNLPLINMYLKQKLSMEIIDLNPMLKLKLSGSVRNSLGRNSSISSYTTAIGLALKGFL